MTLEEVAAVISYLTDTYINGKGQFLRMQSRIHSISTWIRYSGHYRDRKPDLDGDPDTVEVGPHYGSVVFFFS